MIKTHSHSPPFFFRTTHDNPQPSCLPLQFISFAVSQCSSQRSLCTRRGAPLLPSLSLYPFRSFSLNLKSLNLPDFCKVGAQLPNIPSSFFSASCTALFTPKIEQHPPSENHLMQCFQQPHHIPHLTSKCTTPINPHECFFCFGGC
jgi:hypothetical protein